MQQQGKDLVIPVVEEQVQIDTIIVDKAVIRVTKTVREQEQVVTVPLVHERIEVTQVPVNAYVSQTPVIREEGNTTIIPVVKEVLVIEKRLLLVEEIHVTRHLVEETHEEHHLVRKEEVTVDRQELPGNPSDNTI